MIALFQKKHMVLVIRLMIITNMIYSSLAFSSSSNICNPFSLCTYPHLNALQKNKLSCGRISFSALSMKQNDKLKLESRYRSVIDKPSFINKTKNQLKSLKPLKSLKSLKLLAFVIPLLQNPTPANAVFGALPRGMPQPIIEKEETQQMERQLVPPDPENPIYQGRPDLYDIDVRRYERKLKAKQEEEEKREKEREESKIRRSESLTEDDILVQQQALQLLQSPQISSTEETDGRSSSTTDPATTGTSSPKMNVAVAPKLISQKKVLTAKQRGKQLTAKGIRYAGLISAGIWFAKAQNSAERKRVKQGIEIFESQKAEFFNITGKADSDEKMAGELEKLKGNSTSTDDDDDDDDDDEDDGGVSVKENKPPGKGDGGGNSGGSPVSGIGNSSGSTGSPNKPPPVEDKKASDDDIERMKRLFDK